MSNEALVGGSDTATKQRDTRTHGERITALRQAFESLKIRAIAKGSVNECTLEKVRKLADVSDVYFYSNKLKDPAINKLYHAIKEDIAKFKTEFNVKNEVLKEKSELSKAVADKEAMQKERDAAHAQCAKMVEENCKLTSVINFYKERASNAEVSAIDRAYAQITSATAATNVVSFIDPKVISMDAFLLANGISDFSDESKTEEAWRAAYHELSTMLRSINLPIRLYILIGAQYSGKSTWLTTRSHFYNDRQPIVLDMVNLTPDSRSHWLVLLAEIKADGKDIKVCGVYFDVPLEVLVQRNNDLPPNRRLPDHVIQRQYQKLISPTAKERFDEIIIVRHK